MTKKGKGANEDKMIETKSKSVTGKSQNKKKPVEKKLKPVEKEVKSLKEEDLLQESGTDSDYDGDVFFLPSILLFHHLEHTYCAFDLLCVLLL